MGETLPKNKELEAAMLCVDGRRFLARLDWVRKDLSQASNAWTFVTKLAEQNPVKFMSYVDDLSQGLFEWEEIDQLLKDGISGVSSNKIPAIKLYRERTRSGLKEAKEAIEARMRVLGLPVHGGRIQ